MFRFEFSNLILDLELSKGELKKSKSTNEENGKAYRLKDGNSKYFVGEMFSNIWKNQ